MFLVQKKRGEDRITFFLATFVENNYSSSMWLKSCCANSIITRIAEKSFRFFIFMNFTSFYPSGGIELNSTFHLGYRPM